MTVLPNIVPVHGAWADGSSWRAVIQHLQADGYTVTAPQVPPTRLADDVGLVDIAGFGLDQGEWKVPA